MPNHALTQLFAGWQDRTHFTLGAAGRLDMWTSVVLPSTSMTRAPVSSFRFSPELLERIDRYAERLARETGLPVSPNAAAAKLLVAALDTEESQTGRSKRPSSRAPRR